MNLYIVPSLPPRSLFFVFRKLDEICFFLMLSRYELLPLAPAGKEKALELGLDSAQSQWHLLDAVLSQGGTLNKADLVAWGILAPSVVSGLSLDELRPRDRPRVRQSRRIPHSSGGGGGWRELHLESSDKVGEGEVFSDGAGGSSGIIPDVTSSDGGAGDVKVAESRVFLTSQITQQGDRSVIYSKCVAIHSFYFLSGMKAIPWPMALFMV